MSLKLTGPLRRQFREALISAFLERTKLAQMLSFQMDMDISLVDVGGSFADVTFNLVRWAESHGRIEELLASARRENPGNPELLAFERTLYAQVTEQQPQKQPQSQQLQSERHRGLQEQLQESFSMPGSLDLSPFATIHDTGPEATSAAIAIVTAMETSLAYQGQKRLLSARYLHEATRRYGKKIISSYSEFDYTFLSAMMNIAGTKGVPLESVWPYEPNMRQLPSGKLWKDLEASQPLTGATFNPIIPQRGIPDYLHLGRPIIAEVKVYDAAWRSAAVYQNGQIERPLRGDKIWGRIFIVIVGYNPSKGSIRFAGVWGEQWGDKGFGIMNKEAARFYLTDTMTDIMWAVESLMG